MVKAAFTANYGLCFICTAFIKNITAINLKNLFTRNNKKEVTPPPLAGVFLVKAAFTANYGLCFRCTVFIKNIMAINLKNRFTLNNKKEVTPPAVGGGVFGKGCFYCELRSML